MSHDFSSFFTPFTLSKTEAAPSRRDMILSEAYADLVLPAFPCFLTQYEAQGAQLFNDFYGMIHYPLKETDLIRYYEKGFFYNTLPKLYTLLDTVNLEASGVTSVQNQPVLNLKGKGVILGFLDTGIDYTHPAFLDQGGKTRICGLWDQTLQSGTPPYDLDYGSAYSPAEINEALRSPDPFSQVPSRDENGHGTALAGIAAGSSLLERDFLGVAPQALIAMVKLKEAKNYLKELFYVTGEAPAYQMTDIMMGIRYLLALSQDLGKPLVLCLGLGTNQGAHSGSSPLDSMLSVTQTSRGIYAVAAAGNEAGKAHHYYGSYGNVYNPSACDTVEILVPEGSRGFCAELWGQPPQLYSVGFETPLGEFVQRIPPRLSYSQEISFILENTKIYISSEIIQTVSGNQLIFMRFSDPTPGSWKIRVYSDDPQQGSYHIWLPITGFSSPDITFLEPNPDTTLTAPSAGLSVITCGAYNAYDNSLFLNSSRGYTRSGLIKPDFTAPGVGVLAPAPQNSFSSITGTSPAAAHTAGACALLAQWGLERTPPRRFNNQELKALFIRGAKRSGDKLYPNREWGYGTLDVYQIFSSFTKS